MTIIENAGIHLADRVRLSSNRRLLRASVAGGALLAALAASPLTQAQAAPVGNPASCPWLNDALPVATRVDMLLSKMTVADEIALVQGNGSSEPYVFYVAGNPSLCIPATGYEDGPEGVADGLMNVTQLPASIDLAATFSQPLAYVYGAVIGSEQSAKGSAADLGPTVNIDRDPRWGRTFESLSEDPQLTSLIGEAEIVALQGRRVIAEVKHFDAYNQETNRNSLADDVVASERTLHEIYEPAFHAAIQGAGAGAVMCAYSSVNGEYSCQNRKLQTGVLRDEDNLQGLDMSDYGAIHDISAALAGVDSEQPENTFFGSPLESAVEGGTIPRAVLNSMVAPILTEMFRFDFFDNPPSGNTSTVATNAVDQGLSNYIAEAGSVLLQNQGNVLPISAGDDIAVIGPAASVQVVSGGGGSAHVDPSSAPVTPLAGLQAASTGTVTYAQGLPTDMQLTAIPQSDLSTPYSPTNYGGSYSATLTAPATGTYIIGFTNPGSYNEATLAINGTPIINNPGTPPVAVYSAAIQLQQGQTYSLTLGGAGPTSNLVWALPATVNTYVGQAVTAAKAAKEAVVVVADDTESEAADRPNLQLPSAQDYLIEQVAAANPRTVVVVQAGAPITMPWLGSVSSVLDTWYPGQTDGTALAALLYGKANPGGHLPITFPTSLSAIPTASPQQFPGVNGVVDYSEGLQVGYRYYDANNVKPLFPFGFGLSYTTFGYSGLAISNTSPDGTTPITVSATITNTGSVAGTDAAQLYIGFPAAAGEPPRKLVAFKSVLLLPGQSQRVSFTINPRDEQFWGTSGWDETAGTYNVYVGDSSATANLPLTGSYTMTGALGARKVTVSAPASFKPGTAQEVMVTLGSGGTETLNNVALSLAAPGDWKVTALQGATRTNVLPGQSVQVAYSVTPPVGAPTNDVTLFGTADFRPGQCAAEPLVDDATGTQNDNPVTLAVAAALGKADCVPVVRQAGVRVRLKS